MEDDLGYASDDADSNSDVIVLGISVPDMPIAMIIRKVHQSRSYKCLSMWIQLRTTGYFCETFYNSASRSVL